MSFSKNLLKALLVGAVVVMAAGFAGSASATADQAVSKQISTLESKSAYNGSSHRGPRVRRAPYGCDGPPRRCHVS